MFKFLLVAFCFLGCGQERVLDMANEGRVSFLKNRDLWGFTVDTTQDFVTAFPLGDSRLEDGDENYKFVNGDNPVIEKVYLNLPYQFGFADSFLDNLILEWNYDGGFHPVPEWPNTLLPAACEIETNLFLQYPQNAVVHEAYLQLTGNVNISMVNVPAQFNGDFLTFSFVWQVRHTLPLIFN